MFEVHQAVISRSGKDSGGYLAVVAVDDEYVFVCDGKRRSLNNPKRKNPVHLSPTDERLEDEAFFSNRALRKALAKVRAKHSKE